MQKDSSNTLDAIDALSYIGLGKLSSGGIMARFSSHEEASVKETNGHINLDQFEVAMRIQRVQKALELNPENDGLLSEKYALEKGMEEIRKVKAVGIPQGN